MVGKNTLGPGKVLALFSLFGAVSVGAVIKVAPALFFVMLILLGLVAPTTIPVGGIVVLLALVLGYALFTDESGIIPL